MLESTRSQRISKKISNQYATILFGKPKVTIIVITWSLGLVTKPSHLIQHTTSFNTIL